MGKSMKNMHTDIRYRIGTVILRIKHKEVITKNSVTNKRP